MIRLSDLPAKSQAELLRRVAALGLSPKLWPETSQPPNSFHREGVGWHAGEFLYRADAEVHGLAHEVGHLAQLPPHAWASLASDNVRTSEDVALIIQVELSRGIVGLGVYRMLQQMQDMSYSFHGKKGECGAAQWWHKTVPQAMREDKAVAEDIAERWKVEQESPK